MNKWITYSVVFLLLLASQAIAQPANNNLDKIVVIVGDHIALHSDINQLLNEYKAQDPEYGDTMECSLVENTITKFILCEKAAKDSISISDEEVEATLDNRLRYMMQMYGSQETLEATLGKSTLQIKDEYRRFFHDQLLAQRMQGNVVSAVKVSPAEVRAYFNNIPKDSLPTFPSMIEVGQIVLKPIANKEVEDYTKQQLLDLRKQLVDESADFETLASIYSQDPGSKNLGGKLGDVSRDELVPEFAAAAFKLQNGELSMPVKSPYGFHLIQMLQRKGEKASIRHILIKPTITSGDIELCQQKLDSIKTLITSGKITFADAVNKFSQDDMTKMSAGMFVNQQTGSSVLAAEELPADVIALIGNLKAGEYSEVVVFDAATGAPINNATKNEDKQSRFVYIKNITEPHVADLELDFSRIQKAALEDKSGRYLNDWLEARNNEFYIFIDPNYNNCSTVKKFIPKK
jgi:peptidyl-prolyl cis-trans isomerase SurA